MATKRRLRGREDPRQMALGLGPSERYRLFIAALPPKDVAAKALALGRQLLDRFGLASEPHVPHVRLYGLGEHDGIPHDVIDAVRPAMEGVRVRSFDAVFDGVQGLNGPRRPLALRCGKGQYGFVALQNAIGNALAGAGADRPHFDSRFTPHMTLFDWGEAVPEMALDEPIAWHVEKFSLILGLPGHKHYEPYGEWPLQN
jgi:2'-5' RNA ligase